MRLEWVRSVDSTPALLSTIISNSDYHTLTNNRNLDCGMVEKTEIMYTIGHDDVSIST